MICNGWLFTNTGREDLSPVLRDLSSLELQLCPDNRMSQSHFRSANSTEHTSSLSEVMFFQVFLILVICVTDKKSSDYAQHINNKAMENCRIGRWHQFIIA